jgi:hypothetical protein
LGEPLVTKKETKDGLEVSAQSTQIRNVDELLAYAKIDRRLWEIGPAQVRKWDAAIGNGIVEQMFYVRVSLKPAHPLIVAKDEILAEFRKASPVVLPLRRELPPLTGRYMLEIAPFDLHLGMRAWARSTGNRYDPEIASHLFSQAVTELLGRAAVYPVEKILLVFGNDFFHVDTKAGTTTAGTPQDSSVGLHQMFRIGRHMLADAIDQMKLVAPVEVVTIPGNHDEVTSLFLGEVLDALYTNDANVKVDAEPRYRKYVVYGNTLLGLTHGRFEKLSDLPAIMAREMPEAWSNTLHREWHLGHHHKVYAEESQGVRVRRLPSMTAKDEWHYRQGYGAIRAMEAYLWEHTRAYAGHLNINATELFQ